MFRKESDFEAFERVMVDAHLRQPIRILASNERERPYGDERWVRETVKNLGLEQFVRPEGRPRKASPSASEATS
jgi:hypothetical protein